MHDDEYDVGTDLVRRLVDRSLPQCAHLGLEPLASTGSTNAQFRLGPDLLVRVPRQPGGGATIEKEARWLPVMAGGLTTAVPEIVALGEPGFGYPETWAVTRWIHGGTPPVPWNADIQGSSGPLADDLAVLVRELREIPVPAEATTDPELTWYRGGPLADMDEDFRSALDACRAIDGLDLDLDGAIVAWERALAADWRTPPGVCWYHGDLLAENLLVRDHRLAAVLDFGALAVGDPVVDMVGAWEVLDREGREIFRQQVGADDDAWVRSQGWALLIAVITFPYYWHSLPERCAARRAMAAAVLAEA